jgi:hypothetical protein
MGEVKDTVQGTPPKKRRKSLGSDKNLIKQIQTIKDEVSDLTSIKDQDSMDEGEAEKPNNMRKAALLRAVHSLMTASQALLEEY